MSPLPSRKPRTASRDTDPAVGPSHDPPCASQGQPGCRESPGPQEGLSLGTRAGAGLRERSNHTGTESLPPLGLTPSDIRWGARERCIAQGLDCPVSLQRPPVCSCPPAWEEGGGGSVPGGRSHHLRPGPGTPRVDSSAEAKAWVLELRAAGRRHCPLVATGWNERWLPGDAANFALKGAGPCCAPGPTCVWARRRLRHALPLETRRMPSGDRHAGCVGPLHGL